MDPYKYRPSSSFNSPFLTTNAGAPVYNNESALTVGARGDGDQEISGRSEKTSASPEMMSLQKRRREEKIGIRRKGGSGSCAKENRSPATAAVRLGERRTSRRGGADRDSARRRTNLRRLRRRDRKISRRSENLPDTRGGSGSGAKEIESPVTAAARSENLPETRAGPAT